MSRSSKRPRLVFADYTCPVCQRVLHPRGRYDKARHNGTRVHERAQRVRDLYNAFMSGQIPSMVGVQ